MKWLVGIDEAGRGPLAGPVAVGVAAVPMDFDWSLLPGVGDSKTVKPKDREAVFGLASALRQQGSLSFAVAHSTAATIDTAGIVPAIRQAMAAGLAELGLAPEACVVLLDGALRAPSEFRDQRTIIKGDATEPIIGLASILAKVTRDRYMARMGARPSFAAYRFDLHKGYGTRLHRQLIEAHGLSPLHRRSFCRNIELKK